MSTGQFSTPRGTALSLAYRDGTNDFNTLRSCLDEDEYRLRDLRLSGMALDIGAHIGGVSVALAVDNPDLQVITVEPVPPNVDLLRENIERAGVASRVEVIHAAAGPGRTAIVNWNYRGDESAEHHRFIGNSTLVRYATNHDQTEVPVRSLASLVGDGVTFAKVDCEGCENALLTGPTLAKMALIHGEYHADAAPLRRALEPTHHVTFGDTIPGFFTATLRDEPRIVTKEFTPRVKTRKVASRKRGAK